MKTTFVVIVAMLVLAAGAHAQERTAGQAYDTQVNWAALNNKIDLVSSQNKALAATISKMQACNVKKMIFAPADPGADSNGCAGASYRSCGSYRHGQIISIAVRGDFAGCGRASTTIKQCDDGRVVTTTGREGIDKARSCGGR